MDDNLRKALKKYPQGREIPQSEAFLVDQWKNDHNVRCQICDKGGKLLFCDFCNLSYHPGCFKPPMTSIPKGLWACPECSVEFDQNRAEYQKKQEQKARAEAKEKAAKEKVKKERKPSGIKEPTTTKREITKRVLKSNPDLTKQEMIPKPKIENSNNQEKRVYTNDQVNRKIRNTQSMIKPPNTVPKKPAPPKSVPRVKQSLPLPGLKLINRSIAMSPEAGPRDVSSNKSSYVVPKKPSIPPPSVHTSGYNNTEEKLPPKLPGQPEPKYGYKTQMCEFAMKGLCRYGERCYFAHDRSELRTPKRPPPPPRREPTYPNHYPHENPPYQDPHTYRESEYGPRDSRYPPPDPYMHPDNRYPPDSRYPTNDRPPLDPRYPQYEPPRSSPDPYSYPNAYNMNSRPPDPYTQPHNVYSERDRNYRHDPYGLPPDQPPLQNTRPTLGTLTEPLPPPIFSDTEPLPAPTFDTIDDSMDPSQITNNHIPMNDSSLHTFSEMSMNSLPAPTFDEPSEPLMTEGGTDDLYSSRQPYYDYNYQSKEQEFTNNRQNESLSSSSPMNNLETYDSTSRYNTYPDMNHSDPSKNSSQIVSERIVLDNNQIIEVVVEPKESQYISEVNYAKSTNKDIQEFLHLLDQLGNIV